MFHRQDSRKNLILGTGVKPSKRGASIIELALALIIFTGCSLVAFSSINQALVGQNAAAVRTEVVGELEAGLEDIANQSFTSLAAGTFLSPGSFDVFGETYSPTWTVTLAASNYVTVTGSVQVADRSGQIELESTRTVVDPSENTWAVVSSSKDVSATSPDGITYIVPGSPTNLTTTAGETLVSLSWTRPTETLASAVEQYVVEFNKSSEGWLPHSITQSLATTVVGLHGGSSYEFRVSAKNSAGTSSPSNVAFALPVGLPDAPTALTATVNGTDIDLSWTEENNGGSPIVDWIIQHSVDNVTWITFADSQTPTPTVTVTGLVAATAYDFRVMALNAVGVSEVSEVTSATTN